MPKALATLRGKSEAGTGWPRGDAVIRVVRAARGLGATRADRWLLPLG